MDVDEEDVMWCMRCDEDVLAMRLVVLLLLLLLLLLLVVDSFELEFMICVAGTMNETRNRRADGQPRKKKERKMCEGLYAAINLILLIYVGHFNLITMLILDEDAIEKSKWKSGAK